MGKGNGDEGAGVRVGDRLGQSKTQGESLCATFEGGGERVVSHVEEQHSRQKAQGVQSPQSKMDSGIF